MDYRIIKGRNGYVAFRGMFSPDHCNMSIKDIQSEGDDRVMVAKDFDELSREIKKDFEE